MREREKELFDELLKVIAETNEDFPEKKSKLRLTAFSMVKGPSYSKNEGLMIIGQAANKWADPWTPEDFSKESIRKEILETVYKYGEDERLFTSDYWGDLLKPYNTHQSAFWRVAKLVTIGLSVMNAKENNWRNYLLYSNLYKVSPFDGEGGNPSDKLRSIQKEACSKLLTEELTQWSPKWVLFLTGMNWAKPFIEDLGVKGQDNDGLVKFSGELSIPQSNSTSNIVVIDHPRNKPEGIKEEYLVKKVLDSLGELKKTT